MSRVVVIGATGHIGTYLVPRLVRGGHEVIAMSRGLRGPYHDSPRWAEVSRVTVDRDAEDAAGTLTRVNPDRDTVTARVRVGERPYAVAASPQAIWVGVLGQPVMMHTPSHGASSTIGWLLRLCG